VIKVVLYWLVFHYLDQPLVQRAWR